MFAIALIPLIIFLLPYIYLLTILDHKLRNLEVYWFNFVSTLQVFHFDLNLNCSVNVSEVSIVDVSLVWMLKSSHGNEVSQDFDCSVLLNFNT